MAKNRSPLLHLQGTLGGLTFVRSAAYGPHTRLARGSNKMARINNVLQGNADRSGTVTRVAKPLLRVWKEMEKGFAQRDLWQQMMKRMLKAKSASLHTLLESLVKMEINGAYPLDRLLPQVPVVEMEWEKDKAFVGFDMKQPALSDRKTGVDCWRYSVYVVWLDSISSACAYNVTNTEWLGENDTIRRQEVVFHVPEWATHWLMVLKVQGGRGGKEVESFGVMGMQVVKAGMVNSE